MLVFSRNFQPLGSTRAIYHPLDESLLHQLNEATAALRLPSAIARNDPYADPKCLLARLANELTSGLSGADGRHELFERTMDILRPFTIPIAEEQRPRLHHSQRFSFKFEEDFIPPVSFHGAGEMLASRQRQQVNRRDGSIRFKLADPFEAYVIAAGALRRGGLETYPALAWLSAKPFPVYSPVLAVMDMPQTEVLTTFSLRRFHPGMMSLEILSDRAVESALWASVARTKIRRVVSDLFLKEKMGERSSLEEIEKRFEKIGDALVNSRVLWPDSPFVDETLTFLDEHLSQLFHSVALDGMGYSRPMLQPNLTPSLKLSSKFLDNVRRAAERVSQTFSKAVRDYMEERISSEKPPAVVAGHGREPEHEADMDF